MDDLETVRDMWSEYRRAVMPADAPPVQIIECRRAFYGGVWALFTRCVANATRGNMTEETMNAWLDSIEAEQHRFKESIGTPLEGRE
jgi:hypothetical protein